MTEYEKIMLKLKLVELTQNQSVIAIIAQTAGTKQAIEHSNDSNQILEMAQKFAESMLDKEE